MKYTMSIAAAVALAGLLFHTPEAQAQSAMEKKMSDLQREVYLLTRAIEQSREADSQKTAQLDALIRQAIDATHAITGDLERLQKNLTQSVTEQQQRVAEPLAVMKSNLEQVVQDAAAFRTSIDNLNRRMTNAEATLDEILKLVRTINIPPPAPPAPAAGSPEAAEALFTAALRDFLTNDDLALKGFGQFITDYPNHPRAPEALFYMGMIYDRIQDYDSAVKAFDQVVERYGEVPLAKEARYTKATTLAKANKRAEARREFQAFLEKYPNDERANAVRARIRELGGR
jgi:TolA-binding protein